MKTCLIVLGMHRSGTSAIMGALHALGIALGDDLLHPQKDNPKGFFENRFIVEMNDTALKSLGSGWDDWIGLPENWRDSIDLINVRNELKKYLTGEFAKQSLFGLKDPRICKLMPLWLDLFSELDATPHFIIPVRRPQEIAMSLGKRNGFSVQKSQILYLQHMFAAEFHTRDALRVFVPFSSLMDNPVATMHDALKRVGLENFIAAQDTFTTACSFIDKGMQHHHARVNSDDKIFWSETLNLDVHLHSLASASIENQADIVRRIDTIRDRFAELSAFFYNADEKAIHLQRFALQQQLAIARKRSHMQQQALRNKEEQRATLEERLARLDAQVSQLYQERYAMRNTLIWRMAEKTRLALDRFLPPETARRRGFEQVKNGIKRLLAERRPPLVDSPADTRSTGSLKQETAAPRDLSEERREAGRLGRQLHFAEFEKIEVSIIIPVHNNWRFTQKCLQSVLQYTPGAAIEVIVIDNNSTDATRELLTAARGVRIIANTENKVFVEGCLQGAEISRGQYLLFLNNDTEVTNGWLTALLQPFSDPKVGIVGAKLVYPDKTLQEAGGIIFSDGSGWNYGHGDNPNLPQYCYRKEVDYCSGACLLIPTRIWNEVGGFDRRYAPAYYEDTDLCFGVRDKGYKVIYQPEAEIVHFGGASAGRDTATGYKRFQDVNREKFIEKWQVSLRRDHHQGANDLYLARERGKAKRILIVDHYAPAYDKDSGSLRMFSIIEILLELNYKIAFWPDIRSYEKTYIPLLQRMGVEILYEPLEFHSYFKEYGCYFDVVLLSRPYIAEKYIDTVQKYSKAATIYDTVDLHFLREQRQAELAVATMKKTEFSLAEKCDATLVVSSVEHELLASESFGNKVEILSNIHKDGSRGRPFDGRDGAIFIGAYDHAPNEDGVVWFVKTILPEIRKDIPEFTLTVLGSNPTPAVLDLACDHVIVTGYVADVSEYFECARVFVSPLRYGAGVKGKIGHAFSFGLPVVTTSIGAEGMALVAGRDAMIADNAEEFARATVELYRSGKLWREISRNCRKIIAERFSRDVAREKLQSVLQSISAKHRQHVSAARPLIVHYHLFKNAGTTFDWSLKRNFGANFIDHRDDEAILHNDQYLKELASCRPDLYAVSSHHLPAEVSVPEGCALIKALFLRHPIERIGSVYRFEKYQDATTPGSIKAKELDLAGYVKWRMNPEVNSTIRNFHVTMLLGEHLQHIMETDYRQAVLQVRSIGLLGLVEYYDESMVLFEETLKKFFPDIDLAYVPQNVNRERLQTLEERIAEVESQLGDDLAAEVREQNKWDLLLYEDARTILFEKIDATERFTEKLTIFRNRCSIL